MLRDLFGFELAKGGHVAALAFDVQAIGKARYNNAQASLRRACARLYARRLIGTQRGQSHGLHWTIYERSGIGLTEAGVAAAAAAIENKPPDEVPLPEPVAAKVAPARRNKVRS